MAPTTRTIAMRIHIFLDDFLAMVFSPLGWRWFGWWRRASGVGRRRLRRQQIAPIGTPLHLDPGDVVDEWLTYAHLPAATEGLVQTNNVRRCARAQMDELIFLLQ